MVVVRAALAAVDAGSLLRSALAAADVTTALHAARSVDVIAVGQGRRIDACGGSRGGAGAVAPTGRRRG